MKVWEDMLSFDQLVDAAFAILGAAFLRDSQLDRFGWKGERSGSRIEDGYLRGSKAIG